MIETKILRYNCSNKNFYKSQFRKIKTSTSVKVISKILKNRSIYNTCRHIKHTNNNKK